MRSAINMYFKWPLFLPRLWRSVPGRPAAVPWDLRADAVPCGLPADAVPCGLPADAVPWDLFPDAVRGARCADRLDAVFFAGLYVPRPASPYSSS